MEQSYYYHPIVDYFNVRVLKSFIFLLPQQFKLNYYHYSDHLGPLFPTIGPQFKHVD